MPKRVGRILALFVALLSIIAIAGFGPAQPAQASQADITEHGWDIDPVVAPMVGWTAYISTLRSGTLAHNPTGGTEPTIYEEIYTPGSCLQGTVVEQWVQAQSKTVHAFGFQNLCAGGAWAYYKDMSDAAWTTKYAWARTGGASFAAILPGKPTQPDEYINAMVLPLGNGCFGGYIYHFATPNNPIDGWDQVATGCGPDNHDYGWTQVHTIGFDNPNGSSCTVESNALNWYDTGQVRNIYIRTGAGAWRALDASEVSVLHVGANHTCFSNSVGTYKWTWVGDASSPANGWQFCDKLNTRCIP